MGEVSDPNSFYMDFHNAMNATRKKVAEIDDNICTLNRQTAAAALEAVTLFHPKILSYLHDIEIKGHQMDKLVAATQEMKNNLLELVDEANTKSIDYYTMLLENLSLLHDADMNFVV